MPICNNSWCKAPFEVTSDDLAFYEKASPVLRGTREVIPPPTLCPDCRRQRRLAFRNERKLYRRVCDLCQKTTVSVYAANSPYRAYCTDCFWSDHWDPLSYGRPFDPGRPFFEQYDDLLRAFPKAALMHMHDENADYTAYTISYRNSYMCVSGVDGENLLYTYFVSRSKDCVDCSILLRSELCYECTCGDHLYRCCHCFDCEDVSDALLCFDCKNCNHCSGCVGLRGKQYCVLNEQLAPSAYEERAHAFEENFAAAFREMLPKMRVLKNSHPHLYAILTNCENCTGHLIYNSRNTHACFECTDLEDCKYCTNVLYSKDCYDCHYFPQGEVMLEVVSSNRPSHQTCCYTCWESHNLLYCYECMNCRDCFGCGGLKRKQYCILNTQYSKEEYERLVPRIIDHMRVHGEYGEYFPASISTFTYNESIASEEFPLGKEEVQQRGWKWRDEQEEIPKVERVIPAQELPDRISNIPDDILNWAIRCEATRRPFRIVKPELAFYRKLHLPIPHFHPDERHRRRMELRNPRKLWKRSCTKCGKEIRTTYSPERPEIVYCERCYLETVY